MKPGRINWSLAIIPMCAGGLSLALPALPSWMLYLCQLAIASSLAALAVMLLLRSGLLSMGQGLYFFVGAYSVALVADRGWVSDAVLLIVLGMVVSALLASVLGLILSRFRGIFFAMLTLAISMLVYGAAVKMDVLGRSDGINVQGIGFFGFHPAGATAQYSAYLLCVWVWAICAFATQLLINSRFGRVLDAIDENETRVEYLSISPRLCVHVSYVLAAVLTSVGGSLAAIVTSYADPSLAYWTSSGEFVFIALLSGMGHVMATLGGALFLEALRTYAAAYFPDEWQLVQGFVMLAIILFLPKGLSHLIGYVGSAVRRPGPAPSNLLREESEP